jgi:hypothetical protein
VDQRPVGDGGTVGRHGGHDVLGFPARSVAGAVWVTVVE